MRPEAAELRAHHPGLRLPDALVIATGSTLGADTVLTGDAAWRRLGRTISVLQAAHAAPQASAGVASSGTPST